ncbi:Uncharacterized protein BP5553_06715 [Venustampulla echinocandica]|uniref:Uncharacterized protein n=1 Tax=Venustampulla echinocandica TaxID=2656787 RepID=A0A370TKP6_9HELO|nr:Uncharacterized protein BP5553_06715 [Venustampulla echinocandica]RDL36103.1 Uncharacterized protein BP5553_06715 [Venustampulla echinocandica]
MYRLDEVSSNDDWYGEVQALAAANGPIDHGLKIGSALSWKFSKEEVANILMRIERLKSLTQIALEMDHFKLSQALKIDTTVITSTVRSLQESRASEQFRVITDWLSSTDFPAQQSDFIGRRQEETGQWFVVSPEFTNWLHGKKRDLFCPGIPGAGKTMIAAIAVDHIWKTFQGDSVGVAYIYCNYKRRETQTTIDLLAAILKQLVQERPLYGESLTALHTLHVNRRTRPSLDEICTTLNSVLKNYSKAYIIIDALDECTDSDGTRSKLLTVLRSSLQTKTDTRLMVTSRFVSRIEQSFQGSPMLEIRASEADVKRFVTGQLHRLPMCVQRDPELQAEIQDGIVMAVTGISQKAPQTALNEAYDDAIERIESQLPEESELAKNVLSWITYAMRQLTTKELSHALAVEAGELELDQDNIPDIEDIVSVCAGLVAVDEESDVIRLVHYTTQEYFERVREAWNSKAQEEIVSTCLTYLSFQTFNTGCCHKDADFENRIRQNPFLDYSARYWGSHALTVQQTTEKLALPFLRNMNQVSCSIQVIHNADGSSESFIRKNVTGLHATVLFGLTYLLQELMHSDGNKNCIHADARDSNGRTPLWWAANTGNEAVVKLLVNRDDVVADSKDELGQTPLSIAASNGHDAVVILLIKRDDVVVDSVDYNRRSPRLWAAHNGHEAVVKLLVERDEVIADLKDKYSRTPLSCAAKNGHEAVVKLLVNRDDVIADSKGLLSRTPLAEAAKNGHEAVVKLLLNRDDVIADSKDKYSQTPLSSASENGNEAVVKLLLERDDVVAGSKDYSGRTPLSWAAEEGYEAIAKLLIERDNVVADSKDNDGRTPLSWATSREEWRRLRGREALVKLLLQRDDVNANSKDNNGCTPLLWAADDGYEAMVRLLIERDDVDPNSEDNEGYTPLWWATENGHEAVVKLLIDRIAKDKEA